MPPKVKITKEDIISTALDLIRRNGDGQINARAVASALGCSTQPIFSNFASMEELEEETIRTAYGLYLGFLDNECESGKYPKYKSYGMAYIRFAKEEKELFKLLFMRDRTGEGLSLTPDFNRSVEMIMESTGVTRETAELMHLEMWSAVHGIATMHATSFLTLPTELISNMLSDIYFGIRATHIAKEKK